MTVYVYVSFCDFVCIAFLLPFVLGFSLSGFFVAVVVVFFRIVFSTDYHWWICFLVWLLSSFFLSFVVLKLFSIINIFSFFILIALFFFHFFSLLF